MPGYVPEAAAEFAQSKACFAEAVEWLGGPEAAALTHAELEEQLGERGREVHRDHLRAAREQRRDKLTGADGVARTRVEAGHRRGLVTVFGRVTVTRMAYRAPRAPNLHPADAELNLPQERHSHGLRKLAAIEAARGSFADAAATIPRTTGAVIGKRQVEELVQRAAADIDTFYAARRPGQQAEDQLLVLTFDGKGIVMRPEALREATAKAAAAARRKLATRLSPGEKRSRKRMAELAAVYDAALSRAAQLTSSPCPAATPGVCGRPGRRPRESG